MKEGLSQTVDIICMHSVTSYNTDLKLYRDIIICKWEINGGDHYDTHTQADTDCKNISYSWGLWSTSYITLYQTTPTNDQAMLTKYIDSSTVGR